MVRVHAGVTLFIRHDFRQSESEFGGGFWKREHHPGHDFQRLQLMIGEDVMRDRSFFGVGEGRRMWHRWSGPSGSKHEIGWADWFGQSQRGSWLVVRQSITDPLQLRGQVVAEQNPFGESS